MDLSRWGLRPFTRISDRYRNFREFLGDVLEGERALIEPPDNAHRESPFAVHGDIESLLHQPLPSRGSAAVGLETIFEMLTPYFEAGFSLRVAPETATRMDSMFLFGRIFDPPDENGERVSIALPEMQRGQVLRGRVQPVLNTFNLQALHSLRDAGAFTFSPVRDRAFILICNRPQIWQSEMIEKTVNIVNQLVERSARMRILQAKGNLRDRRE